jgi:hypothetical protein
MRKYNSVRRRYGLTKELYLSLTLFLVCFYSFPNNYSERLRDIPISSPTQDSIYNKEKIYIHFDKPYYNVGEDIWYKVYLFDASSHIQEAWSQVVYVELINPFNEIVTSQTIRISDGSGAGDIRLSREFLRGYYTVRAYTNFMRNFDQDYFFEKQIYVNSLWSDEAEKLQTKSKKEKLERRSEFTLLPKPDVQFFPEGGYMLNGFDNRIGFKALGPNGKSINVMGTIIDDLGGELVRFQSSKFGLGMLQLNTEAGQTYRAKINYKDNDLFYELPKALSQGAIIQVEEQASQYRIVVLSSLTTGVNHLKVVGMHRGSMVFDAEITGDKKRAVINVPKDILEDGIQQITLLDGNNVPLSERLIFFDSPEVNSEVTLTSPARSYEKNEMVELEIDLNHELGLNGKVDMSVAVTDRSMVVSDKFGLDIKSHLLLNSELKGNIEQPGYYFESKDPLRKYNLDLLMRTQGWRKYIWNDTIQTRDANLEFPHELGFKVSGHVKSFFNNKKPAKARVVFSSKNSSTMELNEFETDHSGYFEFNNLIFMDTTEVSILAKHIKEKDGNETKNLKGSPRNFHIEMESFWIPEISQKPYGSDEREQMLEQTNDIEGKKQRYFDSINDIERDLIKLEEIQLRTVLSRKKTRYRTKRKFYSQASNTVDFQETRMILPGTNILEILRARVPGLYISGFGGTYDIRLRGINSLTGSTTPLIFLNGTPSDVERILDITVMDVDFVDVIKGPRAAVFGLGSANGVIAVYTLDGLEHFNNTKNEIIKGSASLVHPGFYKARAFYEPGYQAENQGFEETTPGPTLYWNPEVRLTENDKTGISFFTGEVSSNYRVLLEGITSEGFPVKSEIFIKVK